MVGAPRAPRVELRVRVGPVGQRVARDEQMLWTRRRGKGAMREGGEGEKEVPVRLRARRGVTGKRVTGRRDAGEARRWGVIDAAEGVTTATRRTAPAPVLQKQQV